MHAKVMVVMEPGDDGKARPLGAIRPAAPRFVGEAPRLQKERRYIFDRAFDTNSNTRAVYSQSVMVRLAWMYDLPWMGVCRECLLQPITQLCALRPAYELYSCISGCFQV